MKKRSDAQNGVYSADADITSNIIVRQKLKSNISFILLYSLFRLFLKLFLSLFQRKQALIDNVGKLKNGQNDFIVLFLRHPKKDNQDTINTIWRELWRIDVPLEDFCYWEKDE